MLKVISHMQTLMSAVRELTVVSRSAITLLVLTHVAVTMAIGSLVTNALAMVIINYVIIIMV